jgi:hypothetical protein
MEFSITIDVDASADVVFAVLTDIERGPEWTPTVTRVERLDGSSLPLAINSRIRIVQPKVPPAEWTVTALEACRGFRIMSRSPGATVVANLNERYLAQEAAGLKRRCEEDARAAG